MKISSFLLPALFVLYIFPLASQEEPPPETGAGKPETVTEAAENKISQPEDELLYVVAAFEFDIKGRTRPFALIYSGGFNTGEILKGQEGLDQYIRDKTQILINQRVLKDNAAITPVIGEQAEDGTYPVTFTIMVEDSWNIIALPKPEYTTNTGFELTIKARDYNFLGTMNPLRVDLGYRYDENRRSSYQFEVYSDTPFRAAGLTWNVKFDNLFWYRQNVENPFFYQNVTGLSMELPFHRTIVNFGFEEYLILNEENSYRYQVMYNRNFQDGLYMSSRMHASWRIPTGFSVSRYGELTYNPSISAVFNHELPKWPLLPFRKGPSLNFGHSLGFEKIDWHENFRDGLSFFAGTYYNYDFYRFRNDQEALSVSLSLHGAGYFIISKFFGISSRLQYRHWFYHDPEYNESAGDNLRGIADKALHADYMLSLNMDFPLRVLLFRPSKWFNNRKLNFFDVELHVAPVIDLALYHDPEREISFHPKNIAVAGGLELIVFSDFMRNLYIRFGYTVNLRELSAANLFKSGDHREIYLIMGHFY